MHKTIVLRRGNKICYQHFSNASIWVWSHISHLCPYICKHASSIWESICQTISQFQQSGLQCWNVSGKL